MFDVLKKKLTEFASQFQSKTRKTSNEPEVPNSSSISHTSAPAKTASSDFQVTVKATTQVKHLFQSHIRLTESEISDLLFDLELSLLEADVVQSTAEALCAHVKENLLSQPIPKNVDMNAFVTQQIRSSFQLLLNVPVPLLSNLIRAKSEKPFVILLLGPNGAGKTTTLAKLSYFLKSQGFSIMWSASDTFRAASLEQLEQHAHALNIRMIKHAYGSDPAAVAFDAIASAKSLHADVVLIDSAGRQETNYNLMEELKKLVRVTKPDLKLFVGEALAGKSLLDQVRVYDQMLSLDGFILTKLDADTKGGTAISLLHELKKPILFLGMGQNYSDLIEFKPEFILDKII